MATRRPSGEAEPAAKRRADQLRAYARPRLTRWGHLAEVTRKTGATQDLNQVMKMGVG